MIIVMNIIRKAAAVALALMMAVSSALALDLPVKRVKGKEYYVYKVKKGESVYGVSKHLGLSRDVIVRYNPQASDGLKKNMMLYFPLEDFGPTCEPEPVPADTVAPEEPAPVVPAASASVAVMLPFGLEKSEPSRLNNLCLDFYKGFLIGADTLCNRGGKLIEIRAFDTEGSDDRVRTLLDTDSFIARASVIIAPDAPEALAAIASTAAGRGNYVLNLFNIRDTLQSVNPYLIQANIPQQAMYTLAERALATRFEGYVPVILRNTSGRNEKEAFTAYVTTCYRERGIEPVFLEYDGTLRASELNALPVDMGQKYVVIPSSGTLAEFNKMAYVVQNWRDRVRALSAEHPELETVPGVEIFGYPDWTAFRGDALDMLHRLDATVYSRFLDNFTGFQAMGVAQAFKRWYGEAMIESVPTQALLGFDAACCIIKNLRANDGAFDPVYPSEYNGVQSAFRFEREGDGGFVNSSLYIIRFASSGTQNATLL